MELRHLRYFIAVAEELNFTKAAEKLFTVQPSLSQQIKDLEQEVGVHLLQRSNRKVQLTPEGEAFLIHARETLECAKLAIAAARKTAQKRQNQIRISFLNVAEIKVMPKIIAKVRQEFQDVDIHIQSLTCTEQIHRLKNAELDLTFTRYKINHEKFENILLLTERIYIVAAKHLIAPNTRIHLDTLKQYPLILCEENASPIFHEKIDHLINLKSVQPSQIFWVTNVLQHLNLINMGMGVSFLPEYALKFLNDDISIIPTHFEVPHLELFANFHKNSPNPIMQLIEDELRLMQLFHYDFSKK